MPLPPHLTELGLLLGADRERTAERMAGLTRALSSIDEATRLTATDDEHDPEGSTIAYERSLTSTLLAEAGKHLVELDRALERIANGDYGRCERCGGLIPSERLQARPAARTCVACPA